MVSPGNASPRSAPCDGDPESRADRACSAVPEIGSEPARRPSLRSPHLIIAG